MRPPFHLLLLSGLLGALLFGPAGPAAAQGTVYASPRASVPADNGDTYFVGGSSSELYLVFVHEIAFQPGKVRAATLSTYLRPPYGKQRGQDVGQETVGLVFDCAGKARVTGFAYWTPGGLGIYVGDADPTWRPVQPNTSAALAEALLCRRSAQTGKKLVEPGWQLVNRWRETGRP
jgi:hypothetical protein